MNNKRRFAFDKLFNFFWCMGGFLLWFALILIQEAEIGLGIGLLFFALLFFIGSAFFCPCGYLFDDDGITIFYLILANERYRWEKITHISVGSDATASGGFLFNMLLSEVFSIDGQPEGRRRVYMHGKIRKSRRTKRLVFRYWNREIVGYKNDGLGERFRRYGNSDPYTEYDNETERNVREARGELKPVIRELRETARSDGFELKIEYLYIVKPGEELRYRPLLKRWTYTVKVTVLQPQKGQKAITVAEIRVPLLGTRVKRKDVRGVCVPTAADELRAAVRAALKKSKREQTAKNVHGV